MMYYQKKFVYQYLVKCHKLFIELTFISFTTLVGLETFKILEICRSTDNI